MNELHLKRIQQGDGLQSFFARKLIDKGMNMLLNRRPRPLKNLLNEHGTSRIIDIKVCRHPIAKVISKLANIVTLGAYNRAKKQYNYDDVYHLYLIFTFENGDKYIVEKNQRVTITKMKKALSDRNKEFCLNVPLKNNNTLNEIFIRAERTAKDRGEELYRYSAYKYNCQHFVKSLLDAGRLNSPSINKFVMQRVDKLLPDSLLGIRELSKKLTDIIGVFDTVIHGGNEN